MDGRGITAVMRGHSRTSLLCTHPDAPGQPTDDQLEVLLALDAATEGGARESVRHWRVSKARRGGAPLAWDEQRRLERSTAAILGALDSLGLATMSYGKHTVPPYDHFIQWELSQAGLAFSGRSSS